MAEPTPHRRSWLQRYPLLGPVFGLAFVLALFEGLIYWHGESQYQVATNFLTPYTVNLILTQTVIVATGALGMTLIIVSGGIDLSPGSVVALTGCIAALVLRSGHSSWLAAAAAILVGAVVGAANGGVIAGFRMMPFIVTLGTMGVARGLAKLVADNQNVSFDLGPTDGINLLMNNPDTLFGHDLPMWVPPLGVALLLVLTTLMSLVLNRSVFGRHVFALGSNEDTARLCGLRTRSLKVGVYALGGVFVGLAGVLEIARLRQGDPTVAIGLELDIIAAVVIGGASLNGGVGSIWGAVIGALTMTTLRAGSVQMGWPSAVQEIIIGLVIVLAVGLDKFRQHRAIG
jgi:ribose transport system permease protein